MLEVDASTTGVGAVLSQQQGIPAKLHSCAFFSHKLSPAEKNYDIGNRELLAIKLWKNGGIGWREHNILSPFSPISRTFNNCRRPSDLIPVRLDGHYSLPDSILPTHIVQVQKILKQILPHDSMLQRNAMKNQNPSFQRTHFHRPIQWTSSSLLLQCLHCHSAGLSTRTQVCSQSSTHSFNPLLSHIIGHWPPRDQRYPSLSPNVKTKITELLMQTSICRQPSSSLHLNSESVLSTKKC